MRPWSTSGAHLEDLVEDLVEDPAPQARACGARRRRTYYSIINIYE